MDLLNRFLLMILVMQGLVLGHLDEEWDWEPRKGKPKYGTLGYHFQIEDSGVTVKWRRERNGEHEFEMSSEHDGYVAVGFCDPLTRITGEGMENCDIVVGWVENFPPYEPRLADMWADGNGKLTADSSADYELRPGSYQRGKERTTIRFKRKVETDDLVQDTGLLRPVMMVWAWNENDPVWDAGYSTDPHTAKIGTVTKHRSKRNETNQDWSRGHTPTVIKINNPFHPAVNGSRGQSSFPIYALLFATSVIRMINS